MVWPARPSQIGRRPGISSPGRRLFSLGRLDTRPDPLHNVYMTTNHIDREQLEEALEALETLRHAVAASGLADDPRFRAYGLASLEGEQGGWLGGPFMADMIREAFDAVDDQGRPSGPCPECDEAAVVDEDLCCIHCGADRSDEDVWTNPDGSVTVP